MTGAGRKPIIVTSLAMLGVLSVGILTGIATTLRSQQTLAVIPTPGTLPTNVNVTDLDDSQVNSYYSGVSGKSGDQLVSTLNTIIDSHHEYDYDSDTDRYAYKIMDRNWTLSPLTAAQLSNFNYSNDMPYIRKFYANYNDSIDTADLYKNVGATRVSFDKEHLWAQSLGDFGRKSGAGADFHMLVPSDATANTAMHSNYNFATPTSGITQYYGNPKTTTSLWTEEETYVGRNGYISGYSQKVCEPRDEYKGDIARAMFYMPARYYTYEDEYHPKLVLVNGSPAAVTASETQPGLAGDLATLLLWNEQDPVDEYEIHRNNLIYNNFQLNRNPFVDHPEWARIAYDTSYSGSGASIAAGSSSVGTQQGTLIESITLDKSSHSMGIDAELTLVATISPSNAENKSLSWSSTNQSVATVSSNGVVTAHAIGTTTINATATDGSGIVASCAIEVLETVINLEYIEVTGAAETATFASTYNSESIVVTAHYDYSSSVDVTSLATINLPDTAVLGEQSISVTYEGKVAFYAVTVTNQNAVLPPSYADDLFISEYIEGSGYNKAIEIYNGTGSSKNLSDYSVKLYSNGNTSAGTTLVLTDYILANDDVFIISYTNASVSTSITSICDIKSGVTNYNGDDAIGLYKNNVLIDLIGVIGNDPGTEWTGTAANGAGSTVDKTLVRTSSVTGPNGTFTWSEWNCYAIDTFSYLGNHEITLPSPNEQYTAQAEAWADYFLAQTSESCQALESQSSSLWTLLANEYGWMHADSKALFTSGTPTEKIQVAIDRYNAIISAHAENTPFISGLPGASSSLIIDKDNNNILIVFLTLAASGIAFFFYFSKKKRITE